MPTAKPKKKCIPSTPCKDGNHTFIVSTWQLGNGKERAVRVICQHCLMPMDLVEMENARWFEEEAK